MAKEITERALVAIISGLGLLIIAFAEILIFFNEEARDDWSRMLPCAIMSPIFIFMAVGSLGVGVYQLREIVRDKEPGMLPAVGALIYPGIRVPLYWVKRIVFDRVPAFGINPDNVYAVTGLNTMVLGMLWAVEGLIGGVLIYGVVAWIRRRRISINP